MEEKIKAFQADLREMFIKHGYKVFDFSYHYEENPLFLFVDGKVSSQTLIQIIEDANLPEGRLG